MRILKKPKLEKITQKDMGKDISKNNEIDTINEFVTSYSLEYCGSVA